MAIRLEKQGQSINLEKTSASLGEVRINLNWSRAKRGFFGMGKAIDLDVGCLFELQDGRKGSVQALGNAFGSYDQEPFIELMGDDRSGESADGETLRLNGDKLSLIKRVGVYAFIYEGAPNWGSTDGVVTVTVPGQEPLEVRMTNGRDDRPFCGIAMLEATASGLKVTRVVDYYKGHGDFDRAHGWGLQWMAGSKD